MAAQNVNMAVSSDGKTLTITVDLTKRLGLSSTGKSTIIATTAGNAPVPGQEEIKVGLNIYTK